VRHCFHQWGLQASLQDRASSKHSMTTFGFEPHVTPCSLIATPRCPVGWCAGVLGFPAGFPTSAQSASS
jgi:hypothetical protein